MKFFLASETLQRVDKDIVERDTRNMETLIQDQKKIYQEISDVFYNWTTFGRLSKEWWFFYEEDVFIVSL